MPNKRGWYIYIGFRNAPSTLIKQLIKLQNKIVRMITCSYHTTEHFYANTGIILFKILIKHNAQTI